ncbi:hypothetical protein EV182_003962, partial [Spiromyces aspiralis]
STVEHSMAEGGIDSLARNSVSEMSEIEIGTETRVTAAGKAVSVPSLPALRQPDLQALASDSVGPLIKELSAMVKNFDDWLGVLEQQLKA